MSVIIHLLLVVTLSFLGSSASLASQMLESQIIEIKHLQQLRLNIASDAVNRISFDNFHITKLIGNISSFDSVLSEQGDNLFIAPKLPAGKKIDFSALLASGDVIDFSLSVIKSDVPSLVKLKFASPSSTHSSEAVKMIEAMQSENLDKYYVQKFPPKINIPLLHKIKAVAQNSYRFKNLHGYSLILQNTDRISFIEITESDLNQSFSDPIAIYIEQGLLAPKGQTKAIVVCRRGLE